MKIIDFNVKEDCLSNSKKLLVLFPPLYFIHDLEEIITIENFLKENSSIIPYNVKTLEFSFAFILLWIFASIGCYQAFLGKRFLGITPTSYLAFLVPGILFGNGVGHFLQFIFFKGYVPGIITSVFILYPYTFLTAKCLIKEEMMTKRKLLSFFLIGFVL